MRVIGGQAGGHNLKSLKGMATRPTLDRVREAVFNVIRPHIEAAFFLDAFAGTGAVGIEALSQGAQKCYFNDSSRQAVSVIKDNLQACRMNDKAKVYNLNALQLISVLEKDESALQFNLVYVDPPYEGGLYQPFLTRLAASAILAPAALVIVESNADFGSPESFGKLSLRKCSRYGDTFISYYLFVES